MSAEDRNSSYLMSRREFFKRSGEVSLGVVASPFILKNPHVDLIKAAVSWVLRLRERGPEQIASEMILSRRQGWPSRDWAPLSENRALAEGLARIKDNWWAAHVLDMEYQAEGGVSNVQEQAIYQANFIEENQPETMPFAGYCPWLAAAQATEDEPQVFPGEVLGGATDPKTIKTLKTHLKIIKHSGDVLVKTQPTGKNLLKLVSKGYPTILDYPSTLGAGQWFRCLQGVSEDGKFVLVTNFGHPDIKLPISGIVSAWHVYPAETDLALYRGVREGTTFWKFNVDRPFIDWLVDERYRPR